MEFIVCYEKVAGPLTMSLVKLLKFSGASVFFSSMSMNKDLNLL